MGPPVGGEAGRRAVAGGAQGPVDAHKEAAAMSVRFGRATLLSRAPPHPSAVLGHGEGP